MNSINFDNPWLLFLALPIAVLFIIPYAVAIRKDNINGHNIASGIIHILMAVLIGFVAAGTSIVTTVTETNVYVVADVSYSAHKNLDAVDGYISDLSESLPKNSKMGVVTFGKNYQLLTSLGGKIQSVKNSLVDDSATDIISALRYTGELFREDVIKRIVLITDGNQTAETDENALKRQVDALAERNIHVDAIYLDDNIKADARELQLTAAEVTPTTFSGGDVSAKLTINCSCPATTASTDEDGKPVTVPYEVGAFVEVTRHGTFENGTEETVELERKFERFTRGDNFYELPLYTERAGVYDYEVKIKAENAAEDENSLNNVISFTQEVAGKPRVLIIYDDPADEEILYEAYGDSAEITSYYFASTEIEDSVEWLNKFDEIVLANVNATGIRHYNNFLRCLKISVGDFGKSLITFGDTNIQNDNHGELKVLSDMLPVIYGKSEGQEKLYTLLIDTSRSMEQDGRLDRAKRAAKEVVEMLSDKDTVSLVQFNGSPDDIEPKLVKVGEGRQQLLEEIDKLEVRQGTNIPAALQFAVPTATGGSYAERRLMIFSDGINFTTDTAAQSVRRSISVLRNRGVVSSALDVGRGSNVSQNAGAAAVRLLKNEIAVAGGGQYLDITTDKNLEKVLESELPSDINDSEGTNSLITVRRRNDEALKDVDTSALESNALINKFIYSHERPTGSVTTVLEVDFIGAGSSSSTAVPLYSYWSYNNGKVATFATGLSSGSNQNYWIDMSSQMRKQLLQGIFRTIVPEQKISEPFTVEIEATEGYATVALTPDKMSLDAVTSVQVTSPDGTVSKSVPLASAATKFTHTFITGEEGKYLVKLTYKERETGELYTVERAVHLSYSSEYDSFAHYDAGTLHKMIGSNGIVSEKGAFRIVNDEKEVGLYNVSLNMPLLTACVVLFAVDIAVRKLKWEDIKSLFKRHKKVKKQ